MNIKKIAKEIVAGHGVPGGKSIVEQDTENAVHIYPEIIKLFKNIEEVFEKIDKNLSEFNSPGLKSALVNSIKTMDERGKKKFDANKAKAVLDKWFD